MSITTPVELFVLPVFEAAVNTSVISSPLIPAKSGHLGWAVTIHKCTVLRSRKEISRQKTLRIAACQGTIGVERKNGSSAFAGVQLMICLGCASPNEETADFCRKCGGRRSAWPADRPCVLWGGPAFWPPCSWPPCWFCPGERDGLGDADRAGRQRVAAAVAGFRFRVWQCADRPAGSRDTADEEKP